MLRERFILNNKRMDRCKLRDLCMRKIYRSVDRLNAENLRRLRKNYFK